MDPDEIMVAEPHGAAKAATATAAVARDMVSLELDIVAPLGRSGQPRLRLPETDRVGRGREGAGPTNPRRLAAGPCAVSRRDRYAEAASTRRSTGRAEAAGASWAFSSSTTASAATATGSNWLPALRRSSASAASAVSAAA